MRTKTFEIKGIRWEMTTNKEGTKKAVAACPDHPKQEATVEGMGLKPIGLLVWCPQCREVLEMCSKEEFEAEKKKAEES